MIRWSRFVIRCWISTDCSRLVQCWSIPSWCVDIWSLLLLFSLHSLLDRLLRWFVLVAWCHLWRVLQILILLRLLRLAWLLLSISWLLFVLFVFRVLWWTLWWRARATRRFVIFLFFLLSFFCGLSTLCICSRFLVFFVCWAWRVLILILILRVLRIGPSILVFVLLSWAGILPSHLRPCFHWLVVALSEHAGHRAPAWWLLWLPVREGVRGRSRSRRLPIEPSLLSSLSARRGLRTNFLRSARW